MTSETWPCWARWPPRDIGRWHCNVWASHLDQAEWWWRCLEVVVVQIDLDSRDFFFSVSCLLRFCLSKTQFFFLKVSLQSFSLHWIFFQKKPATMESPIMRDWDISFPLLAWVDGFENFSSNDMLYKGRYVFLLGWNFGIDGSEGDKIDSIIFQNFRGRWCNLGATQKAHMFHHFAVPGTTLP